jgi:hypothetical protein
MLDSRALESNSGKGKSKGALQRSKGRSKNRKRKEMGTERYRNENVTEKKTKSRLGNRCGYNWKRNFPASKATWR